MALPIDNTLPEFPYIPKQALENQNRYTSLGKEPVPSQMIQADINWIVDTLNDWAGAINELTIGILPGSDDEANANKIPSTDGNGNIYWTLIQNGQLDENIIDTRNIRAGAITNDLLPPINGNKLMGDSIPASAYSFKTINPSKINSGIVGSGLPLVSNSNGTSSFTTLSVNSYGNATITLPKLAALSVDASKMVKKTITNAEIADTTIATGNIKLLAITNPLIGLSAVAANNINSTGAAVGNLLTSGAGTSSSWQPPSTKGRILQIQSYVTREAATQEASTDYLEFGPGPQTPNGARFFVSITTKAANSTILVYVSANVAATTNSFPAYVYSALFKNGSIWTAQTGTGSEPGLQQYTMDNANDIGNITAFCIDNGGAIGTQSIYELGVYSSAGASGYGCFLNRSQLNQGIQTVSSIYAIEIGN